MAKYSRHDPNNRKANKHKKMSDADRFKRIKAVRKGKRKRGLSEVQEEKD